METKGGVSPRALLPLPWTARQSRGPTLRPRPHPQQTFPGAWTTVSSWCGSICRQHVRVQWQQEPLSFLSKDL